MKQNKIFILTIFCLVFTSSLVIAQPFQSTFTPSEEQYIIEFPKLDYLFLDNNFTLHIHVLYNNGSVIKQIENKSDVECEVNGFSRFGTLDFDAIMFNVPNDPYLYNLTIPGELLNVTSEVYYVIHCQDSEGVSGLISNPAFVVPLANTDQEIYIDLRTNTGKFIVGIPLVISIILLFTGFIAYGGAGFMISGILIILSKTNYFVGFIVFLLGFLIVFSKKGAK